MGMLIKIKHMVLRALMLVYLTFSSFLFEINPKSLYVYIEYCISETYKTNEKNTFLDILASDPDRHWKFIFFNGGRC